jgi:RNA polymerase primary sigma factor
MGRGLSLDELVAAGNVGLVTAVDRFDPSHGTRFPSYAGFWVRQFMWRECVTQTHPVTPPTHYAKLAGQWLRASDRLRQEHGRAPTDEEVAAVLGLNDAHASYAAAAVAAYAPTLPVGDDGYDHFYCPSTEDADATDRDQIEMALDALGKIRPRYAEVLRYRFGLDGQERLALKETGERMGVTKERVRQIEMAAMRELRKQMAHDGVQGIPDDDEEENLRGKARTEDLAGPVRRRPGRPKKVRVPQG